MCLETKSVAVEPRSSAVEVLYAIVNSVAPVSLCRNELINNIAHTIISHV